MKCPLGDVESMERLRTTVESLLQELDVLEMETDTDVRIFTPILMRKLPAKWRENIIRNMGKHPTLELFRKLLRAEVGTLKAAEAYQAGDKALPQKNLNNSNRRWKKKTLVSTGGEMVRGSYGSTHREDNYELFLHLDTDTRLAACKDSASEAL